MRKNKRLLYHVRTLLIVLVLGPVVLTALVWWARLFLELFGVYYSL